MIPNEAVSVTVGYDGTVTAMIQGQAAPVELGQITLASFINPAGLHSMGRNLYIPTASSGEAQVGPPGQDGRGSLLQGALEKSNVDVVEEMVGLISTQRGYEVNSKIITAADEMLRSATQMR